MRSLLAGGAHIDGGGSKCCLISICVADQSFMLTIRPYDQDPVRSSAALNYFFEPRSNADGGMLRSCSKVCLGMNIVGFPRGSLTTTPPSGSDSSTSSAVKGPWSASSGP